MRLFSYVIARDFGFAPNPFYRVCTLATCKPKIRAAAKIGDWIIGTGSKKYGLEGRLVFAMQVDEILTFDEYWASPRYQEKKPLMNGSRKQRYGDNIYHYDKTAKKWMQANSHHTHPDGSPNPENIKRDTGTTQRVLAGKEYVYWGRSGPRVPARFRKPACDVCCTTQGHKCRFEERFTAEVVGWLKSSGMVGFAGPPAEFPKLAT
jgi:hypothetical protein